MQASCPNCRASVAIPPAGGQSICPGCGTALTSRQRTATLELDTTPAPYPPPHPAASIIWGFVAILAGGTTLGIILILGSLLGSELTPEAIASLGRRWFWVGVVYIILIPLYAFAWAIDRMTR